MSNILIPVDFSLACHNAYAFGLGLAEKFGFGVILTHYYGGTFNPSRPLLLERNRSVKDTYIHRLRDFALPNGEGFDYPLVEPPARVEISYEATVALTPSAAVIKRARKDDIALVVMATRSSMDVTDRWLGSNSTTVSESASVPVFLVPPRAAFLDFERIVVANHHETADPYPLWQIELLAQLTGAKMHFVCVENLDAPEKVKFVPWALMEELTTRAFKDYEVVTVDEDNISEGLLDYAAEVDARLLIIVNRLRAHWRSVLHPSLTQHISLRTDIPLLVLHTDQQMETYGRETLATIANLATSLA